MNFKFSHNNINVFNLNKSIKFYNTALSLKEEKRIIADDGSFIIVFMSDGSSNHLLELTWLKDRTEPYNLGDNEIHLCLTTSDYNNAYKHHKKMDCIVYENPNMNLYFIADPDGYWTEIVSDNRI